MKSISEKWAVPERKKRAKKCSNPRGFTMKQFCKNLRARSKKGQVKNEEIILQVYERLLNESILDLFNEIYVNEE